MRKFQSESGRTMLEMLGVLAIMGVLMYGAIAGVGFGVETYKINATYNMLEELSQGVVDLYSWSPDYGAVNAATICNNKVVECNDNKTEVQSLWGAGSQILVQKNGDDASHFVIKHSQLSVLACTRLRDMTYANMCVKKDEDDGCPAVQNEGHTDCSHDDGECVLVLISR